MTTLPFPAIAPSLAEEGRGGGADDRARCFEKMTLCVCS